MQNKSLLYSNIFFIISIIMTIFFIIFLIIPFSSPQTDSILNISLYNAPPQLIDIIPNQTWPENTNLLNAFDLHNYFIDNETMTFFAASVSNISIVINTTIANFTNITTNFVSFYPDANFNGIRITNFTAFDGVYNTTSNNVYLNVSEDLFAPQWSNPLKDSVNISQNDFVNFTTDWTDNFALNSYIFSINQGSGWSNSTARSFSGTSATSSQRIQISAAGGTTVSWLFYGEDLAGNANVTDIQTFTVETETPPSSSTSSSTSSSSSSSSGGDGGIVGLIIRDQSSSEDLEDFLLDPSDLIKVSIKQGGSNTAVLKIANTGNKNLSFEVTISKLTELTTIIDNPIFNLGPGDVKSQLIEISADRFLTPELYFGEINVETASETKKVPLVVEVKPFISNFELIVYVLEEYKKVSPGDQVIGNITITNLDDIEDKILSLTYSIKNLEGTTIDTAEEQIQFNTRKLELIRNLTTNPENEKGTYIFLAIANTDTNSSIDSDLFEIGERFTMGAFIRANLLILLIILFSITAIIFIVRFQRNKERLRLLKLYLLISELKSLIKKNKIEEAVEIYVKVKRYYGEPVSQTALSNREELKKEMNELTTKLENIELASLKNKKEIEEKKIDEKTNKEDPKESKKDKEESKEDVKKIKEDVEKPKNNKPNENVESTSNNEDVKEDVEKPNPTSDEKEEKENKKPKEEESTKDKEEPKDKEKEKKEESKNEK